MMLHLSRALALITAISVAPLVLAESTPSLDDLRAIIDKQTSAIAQGKKVGFAYTVQRSFTAYVPFENLPGKIARQESEIEHWREVFVRKGGLRALAVNFRPSSEGNSHVRTWNGEVSKYYMPSFGLGEISFKADSVSQIDDIFVRLQGPFAWALLPIEIDSPNDCLQGKYHSQMDLRQILAQDGLRVLDETETLDDSKCVVVANSIGPFLWLDAGRGFVVKQFIQPATNLPGVERIHYYNERFVQVAPGLWAVENGFMLLRGPGIDYEHVTVQDYLCRLSLDYDGIRLNEPIEDSAFDIVFPPGTAVVDSTSATNVFKRSSVKGFLP